MAIQEILKHETKTEDPTENVVEKGQLSQTVEERVLYVEGRMSEYFRAHGLPDPVDLTDTIRTLKSVFSVDTPQSNPQTDTSK